VGNESVLCQVCQGVLPASGRESYTPLRGRLIVTNGYCAGGCAERRGLGERDLSAQQPQPHQEEQVRPVPPAGPVRGQQIPVAPGVHVSR
jgi:hypothetical protein